jgi:hypothetical protein
MLAALAVHLIQLQHRVIYISDCYELVKDPVDIMRKALFAAFVDEAEWIEEIQDAQNSEQLDQCCKRLRGAGVRLTFIVDQTNAFDPHPDVPESPQDLINKGVAKTLVDHCSSGHMVIRGASANNQTAKHFRHRQQGAVGVIVDLNGGFSQVSDTSSSNSSNNRSRHSTSMWTEIDSFVRSCVCVLVAAD